MTAPLTVPHPATGSDRARALGAARRAIGLVVAALLAYAVWRGYQHPDLLLDLAAFRFC